MTSFGIRLVTLLCVSFELTLGIVRDVLSRLSLSLVSGMIEVRGLRKLYENHLAVDDISFTLEPGQICGMVGPNGAGKTTTLRCLAGLIPATSGSLQVAGCDLSADLLPLKQRVAYVPDDPPLFDDLTVREHLDFIGQLYRVTDHHQKSIELLRQFDLLKKYEAAATTLSRGMRQKLAVCCAYLFNPQVLLLDEPLTGLDPPGIRVLLDSVRERAEAGTTIIISSHLLAMIESVCTHLLVITEGKEQFFDRSERLKDKYPTARSLEEAYFAATGELALDDERTDAPATIAIRDFQRRQVRS
ncbi:MAG: ABC transporter ATP-binding protein [Rubripirellula sp.]